VFVLRGIGSYVSEYGLAWIGSRVVFDVRGEAADRLLGLPTPFYDASSTGVLLSKITYDAQQIAATASEAVTVLIRNTLTIAFMLSYLLYINWQLTLIAFATFPFVGFAIRKISRRLKRVSVLVQERVGAMTHALEEAIGAHRVVKIFGGEKYESDRLRKAASGCVSSAKQASRRGLSTPINDHRVDRGRRDSLSRDPAERGPGVPRRRLHHLHPRAAAPPQPAEDADQRFGNDPARADGRRERVRPDR
jgi:ABC-type multidrug transport system fused ATPase/permease subunit